MTTTRLLYWIELQLIHIGYSKGTLIADCSDKIVYHINPITLIIHHHYIITQKNDKSLRNETSITIIMVPCTRTCRNHYIAWWLSRRNQNNFVKKCTRTTFLAYAHPWRWLLKHATAVSHILCI